MFFLFFPVPFLFYWYTCLPSIGLGDSVLFLHAIKSLHISTYVNNHNLTAIWGWFFQFIPVGDIAYRGNLSCVASSAIAICIFYIALYNLYRCLATAIICSLFLMISHSVWWHATDLADYSMNTVFVSVVLYLYVKLYKTDSIKYIYALFFISGLALFQHYLLGSFLIGITVALFVRISQRKEPWWPLLYKSGISFFIGLIPWALTFLHDISISHSISKTLSGCLGGPFKNLFFKEPLWNGLVEYATLIFIQFPSFYLLAILAGFYFFSKSWKFHIGLIGILFSFLPIVCFELGLNTWALFAQYISTFMILAFVGSFTVHWIIHHPRVKQTAPLKYVLIIITASSLVWTVYFYDRLSVWGSDPNNIWYSRFNNSYTPNCYRLNEFLANPNKRNYHDISKFCHLLLEKLPPNAEYWDSDSRLFYQVKEYYQQYYFMRPDLDILLINSFGYSGWGADSTTFANRLKEAYLKDKNLYICSIGHPFASHLSSLPYKFKRFYLNDKHWVYKLITAHDANPGESTSWNRWDNLPTDKPFLINLNLDNVLDFHEGIAIHQQDMTSFGPDWKNDDQIFFAPERVGAQLGFLLRFQKPIKADISINITTAYDAGLIEVLLNNEPITTTPIDLYSMGITKQEYKFKNISFHQGNNILTFRVIGKNPKSSDKKLGIDTLEIKPLS